MYRRFRKEYAEMPKVGDKEFPYTDKGMRQAEIHARNTGRTIEYDENNRKFGYQTGGSYSSGSNYGDRSYVDRAQLQEERKQIISDALGS